MMKKLISIIVPVYNEEENISVLYDSLAAEFDRLKKGYDFEIVFTDNHSTDSSFSILSALAKKDQRIRVFRFSRNFGYQCSIYTGYIKSKGIVAIQVDCDLQDPPKMIEAFLVAWEKGYKVVYGVRRTRKENWLLTFARKCFYKIVDLFCEYYLPHDAGDFRLLDRCIIDELKNVDNCMPYLRGEIARMGFPQLGIEYDRSDRKKGKSKFTLGALFKLAFDGIVGHSIIPLRFATYLGLLIAAITFFIFISYFIAKIFFHAVWPPGFTTLALLMLLSISLNACFLGIIGEYLGRIYNQTIKRSITIIEKEI